MSKLTQQEIQDAMWINYEYTELMQRSSNKSEMCMHLNLALIEVKRREAHSQDIWATNNELRAELAAAKVKVDAVVRVKTYSSLKARFKRFIKTLMYG